MTKGDFIRPIIRNLRRGLNYKGLYEKDAGEDPFVLFEKWMEAAIAQERYEPNAMALATASKNGVPGVRTVLLKDFSPEGFVFYTNHSSRKGQDLRENPQASLLFYWASLGRQVLIDGKVNLIARITAEEYFHSRPRKSQIAAVASHQSSRIADRKALETEYRRIENRYKGTTVPCPREWGGYIFMPVRIEFWQGRPNRLHDRVCYTKYEYDGWNRERLAP